MIGFLQTRVNKQPIIALYFELENELKFYNLEARSQCVCDEYAEDNYYGKFATAAEKHTLM